MKNKNVLLISILSIVACGLHAAMLNTQFNHYAYTSMLKGILFTMSPIIYFVVSKDGSFRDMFSKGDKQNIKRSYALGLIVFALILVVFMVVRPFIDKAMIVDAFTKNGITDGNFHLVFIYVVLINAALEEVFFRGFIFMTLYRMNFKCYAYVYSCLLFAFYHIAILNNAVALEVFIFLIAGLVVAGLIFNYLVIKCKSLSGSLIVHISANLSINLIVYIFYLYGSK